MKNPGREGPGWSGVATVYFLVGGGLAAANVV